MFVGIGYDAHRFKKGRKLILGGVHIKYPQGLDGHSDADVLVHAVMDALLGAAGMDDIGHVFPNTDKQFKNASSILLLEQVIKKLKAKKLHARNVDVALVIEKPMISPHIKKMKKVLSRSLLIPISRIGIKATTNEKMGFVGRKEGVVAMAVALIDKK